MLSRRRTVPKVFYHLKGLLTLDPVPSAELLASLPQRFCRHYRVMEDGSKKSWHNEEGRLACDARHREAQLLHGRIVDLPCRCVVRITPENAIHLEARHSETLNRAASQLVAMLAGKDFFCRVRSVVVIDVKGFWTESASHALKLAEWDGVQEHPATQEVMRRFSEKRSFVLKQDVNVHIDILKCKLGSGSMIELRSQGNLLKF